MFLGQKRCECTLAHCYSETCGDNTGEMPRLISLVIWEQSLHIPGQSLHVPGATWCLVDPDFASVNRFER